ncbi:hypothetical protein AB0M47_04730 [Hamadaea sp. NPDC051192]|uniref:hypothetical protein n=1 Tax=Hamadaea sp. NPDC051192 TaxID=3154940 RepID=UPI003447FE6A
MPGTVLDEVFGTRRPTADAIAEAVADGSLEDFGRWCGVYVVAYDAQDAVSVAFFGHSGD